MQRGGVSLSLSLSLSALVREETGKEPEAHSSQESCARLLVRLMTLMHVSSRAPCDSVMHR